MDKSIGARLGCLRETLQLNQRVFAEKLGISQPSLAMFEKGNRDIKEIHIRRVCDESWDGKKVNEEWLRTGNGEMFEQLTDQQKVMKYAALLLKDTNSVVASAIKNFIITYEQLDDISKDVLEKVALKYIENIKKSQ